MRIILLINPLRSDAQNYRLINKVYDQMKKSNDLLCVYPTYNYGDYVKFRKIAGHKTFFYYNSKRFYNFYHYSMKKCKNKPLLIFSLCFRHPFLFLLSVFRRILKLYYEEEYEDVKHFKFVQSAIITYKPDVIIGVSNPFNHAYTLTKTKTNSVKVWYQLDPHVLVNNYENNVLKNEILKEHMLYKSVDMVFVQPFQINAIQESYFREYINKVVSLEFPLISNYDSIKKTSFFNNETINCLYAGALDYEVRNPEEVMNFFSKFDRNEVCLHIFTNNKLILDKTAMFENIFIHPYEENQLRMIEIMKSADCLVSIGNNDTKHIPSKIFDYISCCKPILNFYKNDDCRTIQIIQKYTLGLNVSEKQIQNYDINIIRNWILDSMKINLDYNFVYNLFENYTPEKVSEKILSNINKIRRKKNEQQDS